MFLFLCVVVLLHFYSDYEYDEYDEYDFYVIYLIKWYIRLFIQEKGNQLSTVVRFDIK